MFRLVEGKIRYRADWPGLTADERSEGWVLPCVALPQSDVILDQPAAQAAAAPRPVRSRGF